MRKILKLLGVTLISAACLGGAALPKAQALSCVKVSPPKMLAVADAVAVVKTVVVPIIHAGQPGKRYPYEFSVQRVYKGDLAENLIIMHNPMVGPDIAFEEGESYLVLLRRQPDDSFRTSICNGTQAIGTNLPSEWAEALGAGYPPEAGDVLPRILVPVETRNEPKNESKNEPKKPWGIATLLSLAGLAALGGYLYRRGNRRG